MAFFCHSLIFYHKESIHVMWQMYHELSLAGNTNNQGQYPLSANETSSYLRHEFQFLNLVLGTRMLKNGLIESSGGNFVHWNNFYWLIVICLYYCDTFVFFTLIIMCLIWSSETDHSNTINFPCLYTQKRIQPCVNTRLNMEDCLGYICCNSVVAQHKKPMLAFH